MELVDILRGAKPIQIDFSELKKIAETLNMSNEELANVYGGAITATMINALSRGATFIYQLGRSLGSSVKYMIIGKTCR